MPGTLYLEALNRTDEHDCRFRIGRLPCVIGRGSQCDLNVAREQVSRQHARLEASQDGLVIEDLGSTNGTFVNLERISTPVPIIAGDRIHLGSDEFMLVEGESGDSPGVSARPPGSTVAGHTMLGFTADPTGFPVQAPQFYELLNDELIAIRAQPVVNTRGRIRAVTLKTTSRHPDLDAQHDELQHLAAQLGEEARLNRAIRKHALEAADQSGLDEHPLILIAHPAELDDLDLLMDELRACLEQHTRLQLALELPQREVEDEPLNRWLEQLERLDIQPVMSKADPAASDQIQLAIEHGAWLVVDNHHDTDQLALLCKALPSGMNQVIVDGVDDRHHLERLKSLSGIWLRGRAAAETAPVRRQP